jgi:hypothetical protein
VKYYIWFAVGLVLAFLAHTCENMGVAIIGTTGAANAVTTLLWISSVLLMWWAFFKVTGGRST